MKGVTFLKDETNKRHLVQIDMKLLQGDAEQVEDLIDLLVAESRKDDEKLEWADVRKRLLKPVKR
ncbi:MAG: hypothetical protein KF797_02175 [Flavobacteriales bacterium]|nr:hypothetical protein [Flavobacteriales bacterium]